MLQFPHICFMVHKFNWKFANRNLQNEMVYIFTMTTDFFPPSGSKSNLRWAQMESKQYFTIKMNFELFYVCTQSQSQSQYMPSHMHCNIFRDTSFFIMNFNQHPFWRPYFTMCSFNCDTRYFRVEGSNMTASTIDIACFFIVFAAVLVRRGRP